MSRFASNTSVSVGKTKAELEALLSAHKAEGFAYASQENRACIAFQLRAKQVKIILPLPTSADPDIRRTPVGRARTPAQIKQQLEQETRRRWRALLLVVKAKLEAVQTGISTFEHEFLAYIVVPGGGTVGDTVIPQLESGNLPRLTF
jgi:hypothetical protein